MSCCPFDHEPSVVLSDQADPSLFNSLHMFSMALEVCATNPMFLMCGLDLYTGNSESHATQHVSPAAMQLLHTLIAQLLQNNAQGDAEPQLPHNFG